MGIQNYDINLAANGGTQVLPAKGKVFDFLSSGADTDVITVKPAMMQGGINLKQGQGFALDSDVDSWLVVNNGAAAISGQVIVSDGEFRNFRMFGAVSVLGTVGVQGDVSVIDTNYQTTVAGKAFVGAFNFTPPAGTTTRVQFWNPPGSGIKTVVEKINASMSSATTLIIAYNSAELSTVLGAPPSKMIGQGTSKTLIVSQSDANVPGPDSYLITGQEPASQIYSIEEKTPFVIPEGKGLLIYPSAQNITISGWVDFREE